jgi:hypothetical protein
MFIIISNCIAFLLFLGTYIYVKSEPTSLIVAWFGFTGTELLALAAIKIKEKREVESEDDSS